MSVAVPLIQKISISFKAVFWFALTLFAFLGYAVVSVLPVWMIALVVLAGVLIGLLPYSIWRLLKKGDPEWSPRLSFLSFSLAGVLATVGLAGLPVYYMAYWVDSGTTNIPLATLSNGKKTVVFQGMQHVGSEGFYKSVVFDLEKALTDGYTLFYEGVQSVPDHPEYDEWFNKTIFGTKKEINSGYTQLAKACGMTFQLTYFDPLLADKAINPKRHVTADVSYLDLKNEYERLVKEDPGYAANLQAETAAGRTAKGDDPLLSLVSWVGSATPEQKKMAGILCRGVLAIATQAQGSNKPSEKLILTFRNKALAKQVAESDASKIYITYGAAHFSGFVADLKALDPSFEVRSLSWGRAMSTPTEPQPPAGDWPRVVPGKP